MQINRGLLTYNIIKHFESSVNKFQFIFSVILSNFALPKHNSFQILRKFGKLGENCPALTAFQNIVLVLIEFTKTNESTPNLC